MMIAAATSSARGLSNICVNTWLDMASELDTRVTMIAVAVDSTSDGICATSPSPMVSSV